MKINRRAVLSTATVLGAAALVAGGTIAYFTDRKTETNSFTVGKTVSINLYESQLHRQNSGRTGTFTALLSDPDYCDYTIDQPGVNYNNNPMNTYESARYCTPGMDANQTAGISAVTNGHTRTGFSNANRNWGYSDQTIIDDAATYKAAATSTAPSGYFSRASQKIVPGQWIRKFSYVKNTDTSNDAYVLIRYMVPAEYADKIELKIPGTPYEEDTNATVDGIQAYFYAVDRDATGKYSAHALTETGNGPVIDDPTDGYKGYDYTDTSDNKSYKVYAAVTVQPIKSGEMTYWSPINTVRLATSVTDTDMANIDDFGIIVEAEAIQAKPFTDAIDAINHL